MTCPRCAYEGVVTEGDDGEKDENGEVTTGECLLFAMHDWYIIIEKSRLDRKFRSNFPRFLHQDFTF